MIRILDEVRAALEFAGGVVEQPPLRKPWMRSAVWWGFWWAVLLLLVLSFSGQTSKFIYIDF
jgi:hypothetical protein